MISNIDLKNSSSWKNKIFLTFDMDWCSDEVLDYTLDILEEKSIQATFFVTHKTELLTRMRKNSNIELGIHPNFNFLLNGDFRYGKNIDEVIEYYLKIVPEAKSVRAHSLTQNSNIINNFKKLGLKFHCNTHIPYSSNIDIKPYLLWNDMVEAPFFWEDDIHCLYNWEFDVQNTFKYNGLKIYNFHPIHIFLNTEKLERYTFAKDCLNEYGKLKEMRNMMNSGVNDYLNSLIKRGFE